MKTLVRWNPARDILNMQKDMDRLLEAFIDPRVLNNQQWGLELDVVEQDDKYVVTADVPGVNPDDLDVTLNDNVLTIKGETKSEEVKENSRYHLRERRFGSFARSIQLGLPVKAEAIEAHYENGILTLNIPKAEAIKPRRIAINGTKLVHGNGNGAAH